MLLLQERQGICQLQSLAVSSRRRACFQAQWAPWGCGATESEGRQLPSGRILRCWTAACTLEHTWAAQRQGASRFRLGLMPLPSTGILEIVNGALISLLLQTRVCASTHVSKCRCMGK